MVPGELFVATEFQHIAWLPVIPIQTWVIVEGSIESCDDYVRRFSLTWQGVPIRFSLKSFLMAWLRTFLLIVAIAGLLWLGCLLLYWIGGNQPLAATFLTIAIIGLALGGYWTSFKLVYANAKRADFLRGLIMSKYGNRGTG
jgi:hypothetical protein